MNFEFWPDKKGWIWDFDPIKRGEFRILTWQKGVNFDPIQRGEFRILTLQKGWNFEFWPSYIPKITIFPLFIGSFCKRSSLRSQTFLSFRTLHLAYPKLVGTPCIKNLIKMSVGIPYSSPAFVPIPFTPSWPKGGGKADSIQHGDHHGHLEHHDGVVSFGSALGN